MRGNISHFTGVYLRELQLDRVHKSGLDEGAGLTNAFAVVFRIHEATVVAQVFIEITTRSGENLAEVGGSHLGDLCAHHVADLEDFAEDEDKTLAAVQTQQHPDGAVVLRLFNQDFNRNRYCARVGKIKIGHLPQPGGGHGKGADGIGSGPLGLLYAQQVVGGDAIKPSPKFCLTPEPRQSLDGFE